MSISNRQIAKILNEMADVLENEGVNYYRVRAHRNAAKLLEKIPLSLEQMVIEKKDLTVLPGIGDILAKKITEIVALKELPEIQSDEEIFPAILTDLKRIKGLGVKKIKAIRQAYKFNTIDQLKNLLLQGKIAELPGFGKKTSDNILKSLQEISFSPKRIYWFKAEIIVKRLLHYLNNNAAVTHLEVVGSYRRKSETVGNINIILATTKKSQVINYFLNYAEISTVLLKEVNYVRVMLWMGIEVDLRVVSENNWGAAVYYFSGSKPYHDLVDNYLKNKSFQVSGAGIFSKDKKILCKNERDVFHWLELSYIEPELREDIDVLTSVTAGNLPVLIQLEDLVGDLHCHTNSTDGRYSLEEMVAAAQRKGLQYIAITDHSQSLTITNGLNKNRLMEQIKLIDKLNEKLTDFTILKSSEVDILEDGSLDFPNEILKELDITVCSIHSKFGLSKQQQTERIIRAMDNPYFNILGHATGRLINHRDPYQIDIEKVIFAAKERNCVLEINSQPARLDINDIYARQAKSMGVKFSISSDAHNMKQFDFVRLGIHQARRAGLEKQDVINTRNVQELKKIILR